MKALNYLCLMCVCRLFPSMLSWLGCCRSLQNAGVTADEVNYVNAHATSTPAGDMAEYRAIRAAIPGSHVRINGTKSMIGHLLGAAGAVEAVATVQAIRTGDPILSLLLCITHSEHSVLNSECFLSMCQSYEVMQHVVSMALEIALHSSQA